MVGQRASLGTMDVSAQTNTNAPASAETTPNLLFARLDVATMIAAVISGKPSMATSAPAHGCGLKWKKPVSENGSENMSIEPAAASQTGSMPSTRRALGSDLLSTFGHA